MEMNRSEHLSASVHPGFQMIICFQLLTPELLGFNFCFRFLFCRVLESHRVVEFVVVVPLLQPVDGGTGDGA